MLICPIPGVLLAFFIWLRLFLPSSSNVKLISKHVVVTPKWEEGTTGYVNILFLIRLSPTRFNIYWLFLPESVMTVMIAKL